MSSPKSSIKSKKTKMIQKNSEGSIKSAKVIEIQSSDEECVVELIQKRRKKQPIQNSTPVKLNNFNLERFKKVEYVPITASEPELVIVECLNEEQMTHNNIKAVFYRVEGREKTQHVSDFYLHERIKKMLPTKEETKTQQLEVVQQQVKEKKIEVIESSQEQKQDKIQQKNKPLRYFDIIDEKDEQKRLVKCFNCGKRGHIAKNCLEQREKQKCMYCLGEHHHHDCNARACFRCNQLGHVAQECKAVGIDCHKCGKKGHIEKNCGSVIFMDYSKFKKDREFREKYEAQDLKKLRCMFGCKFPYGHFNCHEYMDKKTKPYEGTTQKPQPKYQNQKLDRQTPRLFQKYQRSLMREDPASMNNRYIITNYGGNYEGQGQYKSNDYDANGSWRGSQNQNQNQSNRSRGYQIQNYGNGRGSSNQNKNNGGFRGRYDTGRW